MKKENLLETCSLLTKVEHLGIYCFRKGFVLIINAQREINDLATSSFYESNPTFRKPRVTFPAPTNSLEQKLFLCMDRFFRAIFLQQSWSSKAMKAEKQRTTTTKQRCVNAASGWTSYLVALTKITTRCLQAWHLVVCVEEHGFHMMFGMVGKASLSFTVSWDLKDKR